MRIIIDQAEIEEAIEKLVLDQVAVPDDMRLDIILKATRGDEGYTAEIDIVAHDAPADGSDRSADPRIQPVQGAETLSIAEKVLEAKQQANLPRRRGRPAGARNKSKTEQASQTEQAVTPVPILTQDTSEPALASEIEKDVSTSEQPSEHTSTGETVKVAEDAPISEPVADEALSETTEHETETEDETEYSPTPETAGFETDAAEGRDPEPKPQPESEPVEEPEVQAATVTEADVSAQASDQLVDSVSDPAPEVQEAPKAPTRSLFANLARPQNGGAVG